MYTFIRARTYLYVYVLLLYAILFYTRADDATLIVGEVVAFTRSVLLPTFFFSFYVV